MIPSDVENFSTDGERQFFGFLKAVAKPDSKYLVWYLPDIHFPDLMMKALDKCGICSNWIASDYQAKRSYDVTTQNVTISTIHSVKGFDYACVFVIGLDWFNHERWSEEQIKNLTYVALTRARERLYILHIGQLTMMLDVQDQNIK